MQNRKSVIPVILVGGKGRRLGKDKTNLSINGEIILGRTFSILERVFAVEPLLIGDKQINGFNTIKDVVKDAGPLGGLYTAFFNTEEQFVFLTACDMPFINEQLLMYMYGNLDKSVDIYIPRVGSYIEPLFAFYNRRLFTKVKQSIELKEFPLRLLLRNSKVQYLKENEIVRFDRELTTFFNVNTKEDEAKLGFLAKLHNK